MSEYNSQPDGNPNHAQVLNFSPKADAVQHEFCGTHEILGAACPNCNKPLLRVLSLNAEDRVLSLDEAKTPVVHVLYCWTCSVPYGEFSYKVNSDGSIEIVQIPERQPDSEFGLDGPYDAYTGIYPLQKVSIEPMDDKVFLQAADVLTAVCPCWMASPLSVSQLLDGGRQYFDFVIFDEASQLLPEDAVPAILRAHRVVVAGDSKQLPPTTFFSASGDHRE